VHERYNPKLKRGWVNLSIGRHFDVVQTCRSRPQEQTRLTVPRAHLDKHIRTMNIYVAGKFTELVFNLDELGSAD
jgi:hypothetical protein